MKNVLKVFSVILLCFVFCGCYKTNYEISINEDKSVDFKLVMALDDSVMNMNNDTTEPLVDGSTIEYGEGVTPRETADTTEQPTSINTGMESEGKIYEANGWTVAEYKEDSYQGFTITHKFDNIDNISKNEFFEVDLGKLGETKVDDVKLFTKTTVLTETTYKANHKIDFGADSDGETDYSAYADSFDLTYKVTLPVNAGENNATTISEDGKTLTWKLKYGEVNSIKYEYTDGFPVLYIIIGASALLVIVIIIMIISSSKKKRKLQTIAPIATEPKTEIPSPVVTPIIDLTPKDETPVTQVEEANAEMPVMPTEEVEMPVVTQVETPTTNTSKVDEFVNMWEQPAPSSNPVETPAVPQVEMPVMPTEEVEMPAVTQVETPTTNTSKVDEFVNMWEQPAPSSNPVETPAVPQVEMPVMPTEEVETPAVPQVETPTTNTSKVDEFVNMWEQPAPSSNPVETNNNIPKDIL